MNNKLKETDIVKLIQEEAAAKGHILWRNNSGALRDRNGRLIRYGLANDSKKTNSTIKSSDLIGIKKVTITQDMVGKTVGLFMCREVKITGWKYKADEREVAQKNFLDIVIDMGGDACFATDIGTI
jgi:hypothetical protein